MLSISPVIGDGSYYTSLQTDNYYLKAGEARGIWFGEGAAILGLSGEIDDKVFLNLTTGFSPDGTIAYFKNSGTESRLPGIDLTFSAPKTLSVLWAVSRPNPALEQKIRECNWAAAQKAIEYLQETVAFGRGGLGGKQKVPIKFIGAAFEHGTSRNLDPQLHVHAILFNTALSDGRAFTLATNQIYKAKMAAGAVYRAELAHQLKVHLGLNLEARASWFEISGIPATLVKELSSRRDEILKQLEAAGIYSAKAAKRAARDTRQAKAIVAREHLFKEWARIAQHHGFELQHAQRLLHQSRTHTPNDALARFFDRSVSDLLERQSFFPERDIVRAVAEKSQVLGIPVDKIIKAVRDDLKRLVSLPEFGGLRQFTTREILDLERELVAKAVLGRDTFRQVVPKKLLDPIIAGHTLSKEQESAVRHITEGKGTVQNIAGLAGTGKSTALAVARKSLEAAGYSVIGCSLSAKAAENLEASSGISSQTIARILHQWRKPLSEIPRLNAKTVLVIDEAAMVGTRRLAELLDIADKAKARVVCVGDTKQLPAIEAGSPFKSLCHFLGMATLTDIRRQLSEWGKEMVKEFAGGDVRKGVEILQSRGLLQIAENTEGATNALLSEWAKERDLKNTIILAGTREEVSTLNRGAQQIRRNAGQLGSKAGLIGEKEFFPGDRVVFVRNDRKLGVKNGSFGVLVDFKNGSAIVQLDNGGKRIYVPVANEHVRLGYAVTTHKSQGATVNRAFVFFSDAMQSRESTYVQVSRAREWTKLFLTREQAGENDLRSAIRAMSRSQQKMNAIELAKIPEFESIRRSRSREKSREFAL